MTKGLRLVRLACTVFAVHLAIGAGQAQAVTPAATPPPGTVKITQPANGDRVGRQVTVEGTATLQDLRGLAVLVRPDPKSTTQKWWVQERPTAAGTTWTSPVYIGDRDTPSGTVFRICVVTTSAELRTGDQLQSLPPGPYGCVDVTRE